MSLFTFSTIHSNDNSMEQDPDGGLDDADDEAGVGGGGLKDSGNHKDGDLVKPLPDGRAPDAPDGFTIVTKENGQVWSLTQFFFCFLFVKLSLVSIIGEILFSSVPPSNSLVSVSGP